MFLVSPATYPPGSEKELMFFEKIKAYTTKSQWIQFLKALNLFANDIITRPELVRMLEDVLGNNQIPKAKQISKWPLVCLLIGSFW